VKVDTDRFVSGMSEGQFRAANGPVPTASASCPGHHLKTIVEAAVACCERMPAWRLHGFDQTERITMDDMMKEEYGDLDRRVIKLVTKTGREYDCVEYEFQKLRWGNGGVAAFRILHKRPTFRQQFTEINRTEIESISYGVEE